MRAYLTSRAQIIGPLRPNDPLFLYKNGQPLSYNGLVAVVRALASVCGAPPKEYAGHSFRRGGATELARRGVPDRVIQKLGRWRSDCYKRYIETRIEELLEYTTWLGAS